MKRVLFHLLALGLWILLQQPANAQQNQAADPSLIDLTTTPSFLFGASQGAITTINYSNLGTDPIPAGTVRISLSLNQYLHYLSPINITGFTLTFSDAETVILTNSAAIPAIGFGAVSVRTVAVQTTGATGGWSYQQKPYTANISRITPALVGNTNSSNDNVDATIRVGEGIIDSFPGPLPVTLLSFTGKAVNCSARLEWKSTGESDLHRYEIEQSTDGIRFIPVQTVPGKGGNENQYAVQLGTAGKKSYYRLVIVQTDGSRKYSSIIPVETACKGNSYFGVYPNPVKQGGAITLQSPLAEAVTYKLIDAAGKLMETGKFRGRTELRSRLSAGLYYIEPGNGELIEQTKIIVQ